jgi:hypothetical protein
MLRKKELFIYVDSDNHSMLSIVVTISASALISKLAAVSTFIVVMMMVVALSFSCKKIRKRFS